MNEAALKSKMDKTIDVFSKELNSLRQKNVAYQKKRRDTKKN